WTHFFPRFSKNMVYHAAFSSRRKFLRRFPRYLFFGAGESVFVCGSDLASKQPPLVVSVREVVTPREVQNKDAVCAVTNRVRPRRAAQRAVRQRGLEEFFNLRMIENNLFRYDAAAGEAQQRERYGHNDGCEGDPVFRSHVSFGIHYGSFWFKLLFAHHPTYLKGLSK